MRVGYRVDLPGPDQEAVERRVSVPVIEESRFLALSLGAGFFVAPTSFFVAPTSIVA